MVKVTLTVSGGRVSVTVTVMVFGGRVSVTVTAGGGGRVAVSVMVLVTAEQVPHDDQPAAGLDGVAGAGAGAAEEVALHWDQSPVPSELELPGPGAMAAA